MNDLEITLITLAALIAIFSPIAIMFINDNIDDYIPRGYKVKEVIFEDLSERYYTYFKVFVFWRHYKKWDQEEYFSTRDEALEKLRSRKQQNEEIRNRTRKKKKVYSHEERV